MDARDEDAIHGLCLRSDGRHEKLVRLCLSVCPDDVAKGEDSFFWTWKIGTSLSVGRVNNPMCVAFLVSSP